MSTTKKYKAVKRYIPESDLGRPCHPQPHWLIPATPEAYDAHLEATAKAIYESGRGSGEVWKGQSGFMKQPSYIEASAALAAIGILRTTKRKATKL